MDALEEGNVTTLKICMSKNSIQITFVNAQDWFWNITDVENTLKLPDHDEYTTVRNVQVIGVPQLDTCLQCKAVLSPYIFTTRLKKIP